MKKQKFEVGDRIAFTIYSGRHKGTIIFVNEKYMIVRCEKENVVYSFYLDDQIYKIKRLVKKKKPVEKRAAREWWIVISGHGYSAAYSSKKDAEHFRNNNYPEFEIKYAREVLDEQGERKEK